MNNTIPGATNSTPISGHNQLYSQNNILSSGYGNNNNLINAYYSNNSVSNNSAALACASNFQIDDVQKLKQQLQDIKEQVNTSLQKGIWKCEVWLLMEFSFCGL